MLVSLYASVVFGVEINDNAMRLRANAIGWAMMLGLNPSAAYEPRFGDGEVAPTPRHNDRPHCSMPAFFNQPGFDLNQVVTVLRSLLGFCCAVPQCS